MKKFLQFSAGAFLLLAGVSLVIASVQPAYGGDEHISKVAPDARPMNIVYVNIDTVNIQYKAYTELADSANGGLESLIAAYAKMSQELETRYALLQERVSMATISTDEAMKEENAINMGLDLLRQQEAQIAFLESDAMAKNDSISAVVALFFDAYAEKNDVDYVLMYGTGMPILYANPDLDVTGEAVKQLNADYERARLRKKEEHPEKKKEK
jgi:Skp family chaperone for outer membrane proteins